MSAETGFKLYPTQLNQAGDKVQATNFAKQAVTITDNIVQTIIHTVLRPKSIAYLYALMGNSHFLSKQA